MPQSPLVPTPPPGHGGSESSAYAARALLQAQLKDALQACAGSEPGAAAAAAAAAADGGEGEDGDEGVSQEERDVWAAQDALIERLPKALYAAFMRADAECKRRFRKSGTTATLAVACGWSLLVAGVGDSCAYLDTGREIMLVSPNHRIDDNADERARIIAAGGARQGPPACVCWAHAAGWLGGGEGRVVAACSARRRRSKQLRGHHHPRRCQKRRQSEPWEGNISSAAPVGCARPTLSHAGAAARAPLAGSRRLPATNPAPHPLPSPPPLSGPNTASPHQARSRRRAWRACPRAPRACGRAVSR
ncbi:MAG: hypothetical protein J3K34DRAFT_130545 [Monoraphidium minutum]|nr:MAG: hypothetical protein J3K34DRAFT_130545 [Monoraphidium minutum]